jgi:hypothetical protein
MVNSSCPQHQFQGIYPNTPAFSPNISRLKVRPPRISLSIEGIRSNREILTFVCCLPGNETGSGVHGSVILPDTCDEKR